MSRDPDGNIECNEAQGERQVRATFPARRRAPSISTLLAALWALWLAQFGVERLVTAGETSCATANCHGNATTRGSQVWKRSAILFATRDPHRRAFDALYTERSRTMLERLAALDEGLANGGAAHDAPQVSRDSELAAAVYDRLVEERCVGCHATPVARRSDSAWRRAEGVNCEACHGAAERWLDAHVSREWPQRGDDERRSRLGFTALRSLDSRAETCVECHVGPRRVDERVYRVDHDLIAAGHPRLDFEFSSALANLPPHWDDGADRARHQRTTNSTAFDSDAWLVGQRAIAAALLRLDQLDADAGSGPDWSRFQCFDCHQRLRTASPSGGVTPRALAASRSGDAPRRSGEPRRWNGPWQVVALELAVRGEPVDGVPSVEWLERSRIAGPSLTAAQRRQFLSHWATELKRNETWSWDAAAGYDLAVAAWLADRGPAPDPATLDDASIPDAKLRRVAREYREALDRCFTPDSPSQYHSPDLWRSRGPLALERLEALRQAIEEADGGVPRATAETVKDDP